MSDHLAELNTLRAQLDTANEHNAKLSAELADLQRRYEIRKSEGFAAEQALFRVASAVTGSSLLLADYEQLAEVTIAAAERLRARNDELESTR